jgi:hypothetical protein
MTVSYTFPENAGFANPAHSDATPCVVRRERAGQVSVSWLGADAGHECAVNEHTLRALARDPTALVTFEREGAFALDPETGEPTETRGDPIVDAVRVDLAELILGARDFAETTFASESARESTRGDVATRPLPRALEGFETVTITVSRLKPEPAPPSDGDGALSPGGEGAAGEAGESSSSSLVPRDPFIPLGLALALEPFAITLRDATRLPDAPAAAETMDATCDPVVAYVRWPPGGADENERFPEPNLVAFPALAGEKEWTPAAENAEKNGERKKGSGATGGFATTMRLRAVAFGASAMMFGADLLAGGGAGGEGTAGGEEEKGGGDGEEGGGDGGGAGGGAKPKSFPGSALHEACASAPLEVILHDRNAPAEAVEMPGPPPGWTPRPKPAADPEEGGEEGAAGGEEEAGAAGEAAEEAGAAEAGAAGEEGAAGEADESSSPSSPSSLGAYPPSLAYGVATFDLREVVAYPHRRRCFELEARVRGRSTTRGGSDLDWRRRPGRFAEADASMRLAFTAAVPVAPPAAEDDARPFRRVAFEIPLREVALYREILDEVHARNAAALGLDPTLDPEETRFELRRRRLSAAEAADATLGVLTGFHVIDGDARRLAVEGTEEALEGIVRVAVRVRSESHRERARAKKDPTEAVAAQIKYSPRVSYNGDLSYRARLYRAFGADLWPMKLSRSIESLTRDAATLSGDRVRGEVRDAIRALDALGRRAWAREAEHAAAGAGWPRVEDLIALDRRFGAELTAVDVSGEAPYERGSWKAATSEMRAIGAVRSRREAAEAEAEAAEEARRLRETTLSTRTTGRRTFKDELKVANPEYLATLAAKRRARLARDIPAIDRARLAELTAEKGAARRAAWQTWNVTRLTREDAAEAERERAEAEAAAEAEAEAARRADDETGTKSGRGQNLRREKPLHPRPFEWPAAPSAAEQRRHPRRVGDQRLAELSDPWDESAAGPPSRFDLRYFDSKPDAEARRVNARSRRPSFKVARSNAPGAFTPDPTSVHLYGDDLIAEKAAHAEAERAAWRAKVVVDDARMALELPIRKRSSALDKTRSMLADEPRKLGVTGRFTRGMPTGPGGVISMFLDEPPMETRGLSLDETFNRSLRADTTERRAAFTAGPGRDFKRVGVGTRSLVHTNRVAEVGKSGRVRTKSG